MSWYHRERPIRTGKPGISFVTGHARKPLTFQDVLQLITDIWSHMPTGMLHEAYVHIRPVAQRRALVTKQRWASMWKVISFWLRVLPPRRHADFLRARLPDLYSTYSLELPIIDRKLFVPLWNRSEQPDHAGIGVLRHVFLDSGAENAIEDGYWWPHGGSVRQPDLPLGHCFVHGNAYVTHLTLNLQCHPAQRQGRLMLKHVVVLPQLSSLTLILPPQLELRDHVIAALKALVHLSSLTLNLAACFWREAFHYATAMLDMTKLQRLSLIGASIRDIKDNEGVQTGIPLLTEYAPRVVCLTHLGLQGSDICPACSQWLSATLPTLPNLSSLDLSGSWTSGPADNTYPANMQLWVNTLNSNQFGSLRALELAAVPMRPPVDVSLALNMRFGVLTHLTHVNADLWAPPLATSLLRCLQQGYHHLRSLELVDALDECGLHVLAQVLPRMVALTALDLSGAERHHRGREAPEEPTPFEIIFQALGCSWCSGHGLERLVFAGCYGRQHPDRHLEYPWHRLCQLPTLVELIVPHEHAWIMPGGLAAALQGCNHIQTIDLCQLQGVDNADALPRMPSLRRVEGHLQHEVAEGIRRSTGHVDLVPESAWRKKKEFRDQLRLG